MQPVGATLDRAGVVGEWHRTRCYSGHAYDARELLERKPGTVSVVLPARGVAATVGSLLDALAPFEESGLVDELVVIDADSPDGTAAEAALHGAVVLQESELMPEFGPARGKGDAMWRGLAATQGDVVAFLDTDTEDFAPGFLPGLLGPLFDDPGLQLVKGSFRRPLRIGEESHPDEGGRVTELMARPLLNLHVPELAGFRQPLAGEVAARRGLLERLAFPVGYGVEVAMLIDALRAVGLDALGQVDLGSRQNRHQPLRDLGAMAYAVLATASRRIEGLAGAGAGALLQPLDERFETREICLDERPPLASLGRRGGSSPLGELVLERDV